MIKRFLLWLNYFLQDLEDAQGWRPIEPSWAEMLQRLDEASTWVKSLTMIPLGVHCAMYGHKYDQWFEGGEICLNCGEKRVRPTVTEKKPTERSQCVDSIMIALQLRPDTIAEARELRRRIEDIAQER